MFLDLGPTPPTKTATLKALPSGRAGVRATLALMVGHVRNDKKLLGVRQAAQQLVQHLPQKDFAGQVRVLHAFVRDHIRYLRDIRDVETLQGALYTLQTKAGDCDDKSILLAALLESIGHPTRFHAIGFAPGQFAHVYVDTLLGRRWVPLETTEPGWEPGHAPPAVSHMVVNI